MAKTVLRFEEFELDERRRTLVFQGSDDRTPLFGSDLKAFEVLATLAKDSGEVLSSEEIMNRAWGSSLKTHGVKKYISVIRTVLGDNPDNPRFIETIRGQGYRFLPPVIVDHGVCNVPYLKKSTFQGRDETLKLLKQTLSPKNKGLSVMVLQGIPGVGKTRTAAEYALRFRRDYSSVFWIRACSEEDLLAGLASVVNLLELRLRRSPFDDVRAWLEEYDSWLLVFDDAASTELIKNVLPGEAQGAVLITTRNPGLKTIGTLLHLRPLASEDALAVLERISGRTGNEAAKEICEILGNLPLALELAGSFVEATHARFADYRDLLKKREFDLLEMGADTAERSSLGRALAMAVERVRARLPESISLLEKMAFCDSSPIPVDFLQKLIEETQSLEYLVKPLLDFALAGFNDAGDHLILHPVVQLFVRSLLEDGDIKNVLLELAEAWFFYVADGCENHKKHDRCATHCISVANLAVGLEISDEMLANLLMSIADYFHTYERPDTSRNVYLLASRMFEEQSFSSTGNILCQAALAEIANSQDNSMEALWRAWTAISAGLVLRVKVWLGIEKLDFHYRQHLGDAYVEFAHAYLNRGHRLPSTLCLLTNLSLWRKRQPPTRLEEQANQLINTAHGLMRLKKTKLAEATLWRAFGLLEECDEKSLSTVGWGLVLLAEILESKNLEEACSYALWALSCYEEILPEDHPRLVRYLITAAHFLAKTGEFQRACELLDRAKDLAGAFYTDEDPEKISVLSLSKEFERIKQIRLASNLREQALLYLRERRYEESD